jgi:uncharacterized protein YjbI with pentapeptide repeats
VIAVAFVTPVLATATATPASADTVVDGCTIVSNPTSTHFTNCPGTDFAGANLSSINLSYADLAGAAFADCDVASAGCRAAILTSANFTQANLSSASFAFGLGTTGLGQICGTATLTGATLTQANLSNATFFNPVELLGKCGGIDLTGANLSGADLAQANLDTLVDFSNANLSGANLTGTTLGDNLTGANLTGAILTGASMDYPFNSTINFPATLTGANLTSTLLVPSNQTVTATSQSGAVATWSTPAAIPGATPGSCTPASGSNFPLFSSTVTCRVTDTNGEVATGTFHVNVAPTTQFFTQLLLPSDGTVVQGLQVLDAAAADPAGIKSVVFELTGGALTDQVIATASPTLFGWLAQWNPGSLCCGNNGTYSLQSVATDANGNTDTSAPITITLNIQAPTISIVSPSDGATVAGDPVSVDITASAPGGVQEVGLEITSQTCGTFCFNHHFVGADTFGPGTTTVSTTIGLDSYRYPNGTYTLDTFVNDEIGQTNFSAPITVTVDNPLPVTLIPSDGATQSGTAALLDASATGPLIPPYVTFEISGGTLSDYEIAQATPTLYGWLAKWDTTSVPNGTYTLNSVATYLSGAIGAIPLNDTSAPITITVNNAPPSTLVGLPANGASVSRSQFLDASASPGVTQVQYELSGGPNNLVDQVISGSTRTHIGWLGGWNTSSVPNGTYQLNSVASYAGGVSGVSPPITITVSN